MEEYSNYNEVLGNRESGNKYDTENSIGYVGRYQMGAAALTDLGYVNKKPKGISQKDWLNSPEAWTGKDGISSKDAFLNSPEAQDSIQTQWNQTLDKRNKKLYDQYEGKVIDGVTMTKDKIRGMSHLAGTGNVSKVLKSGKLSDFNDAYGTSTKEYAQLFDNGGKMEQPTYSSSVRVGARDRTETDKKAAENDVPTGILHSSSVRVTPNERTETDIMSGGDMSGSSGIDAVTRADTKNKVNDEGMFTGMQDVTGTPTEVTRAPMFSADALNPKKGSTMVDYPPEFDSFKAAMDAGAPVKEVEKPDWVSTAGGFFDGLVDGFKAFLITGSPGEMFNTWNKHIEGSVDADFNDRMVRNQRRAEAQKLMQSGRATGQQAEQFINTGDMSVFQGVPTGTKESDTIAREKWEAEKAEKAQKKQQADQSKIDTLESTLSLTNDLLSGDTLEQAAGWQSNLPTIAGSDVSGWEGKLDTLKSQSFLNNIKQMTGMGALSDNEGKQIANAQANLSLEQPDKVLRENIQIIKRLSEKGLERIKSGVGADGQSLQFGQTAEATKRVVKTQRNPRTGQRRNVYSDGSVEII